MQTPQLFNFNQSDVRVIRREDSTYWFVAKDVVDALGIDWQGKRTLAQIRADWQGVVKLPTPSGTQSTVLINEQAVYKLAFRSNKPEAEAFTDRVAEMLTQLRQSSTSTFRSLILPAPTDWELTFPREFMRQVMRLHGHEYDPKTGTHSWVGKFINKYVYGWMDKGASDELKTARKLYGGDDETAFLHQFLNGQGRGLLKDHLIGLVTLLKSAHDSEHFEGLFNESFRQANQLKISFRR